eukprot:scaffold16263_cov39-Cyclotella_meneghiniana.AAC.3
MVVLLCTLAVPRIDDNHDCRGSMATICGFNRDGLNPKVSPKNELCITHHKRGRASQCRLKVQRLTASSLQV